MAYYDADSLADVIRRAINASCTPGCARHTDQADAIASHALDEINDDIGEAIEDAVNEYAAGEDL